MNLKKKLFRRIMSFLLSLVLLLGSFGNAGTIVHAETTEKIKVACVGDSLTEGFKSSGGNKSQNAYPAYLQTMLGDSYDVGNFGKTSYTLMKGGAKSYWDSTEFTSSKSFNPNIVIIMLGTNDSKTWNETQFKEDAKALVAEYEALESVEKVIFATSPACFVTTGTDITASGVDTVVAAQRALIEEKGWDTIDLYAKTENKQYFYNDDNVHFSDSGYQYIAGCMYEKLTGNEVEVISHRDTSHFKMADGQWETGNQHHTWSKVPSADNPGATCYEVTFTGDTIEIYAGKNHPMGYVKYFIDGVEKGEYNLYNASNINSALIAVYEDLGAGEHTLKAEAAGTKIIDCAQVVVYPNGYPETEETPGGGEVNPPVEPEVPAEKPANGVAYYSFDKENGENLWGEGAGTVAESAAFAEGKSGKALSVTTALQGMTLADTDTYDNTDWTICYWVKADTIAGEVSVTEDATKAFSTALKMAADRASGFRVGDGGGDVLTNAYSFEANEWYHVAWTQDKSAGYRLFVNGVENNAINAWTANNSIKAPIEVIGGTGFTGLIDEVKIFNTALTSEEVLEAMSTEPAAPETPSIVKTTIRHTETNEGGTLDSNYFTFPSTGWTAGDANHVWSETPSDQNETTAASIWYQVDFVGSAIEIYAGKNKPMGYVNYYIDDQFVGEFDLYNSSNIPFTKITTIEGLEEGPHVFKATATLKKNPNATGRLIDCAKVVVHHAPYTVESIALTQNTLEIPVGATETISYTVKPTYAAADDITFVSSDESVASVDENGVITANKIGNATITVASESADVHAEIAVTVRAAVAALDGSIVSTDKQWTDNRYDEVKNKNIASALLTGWKNDTVVSELALIAAESPLENVTVTASDLTSGSNVIKAENVTASFIKSSKAYNGAFLGYGSTTRPVPADNGSNRAESADIIYGSEPVALEMNDVQPVWVEFDIPKNAAAGTYTGTLTVTADGVTDPLEFTYSIEVQDAVLKDAEEFVNSFDIMQWQYPYTSAEYYDVEPFSAKHLEILESSMQIYKEAGGNAITATMMEEAWSGQTYSANEIHYPSMIKWTKNADGSFTYDYTDFDQWVTFCKGMGLGEKITVYGLAPWHNSFKYWENGTLKTESYSVGSTRYVAVWTDFLTKFIVHLEEKGWFDNVYLGIDERGLNAAAFDVVDSVKNSEGKALKTSSDIDNITNHWEIAQRVTDLNVGDTAAYTRKAQFQELLEIRKAKGYKTTLYSCTEHQPGQFSLSAPVESYWAVLNAGMMGADGFNRWAYDAWVADPLRDTTHNAFEAGDCFVIFPDEKDAQNPTSKSSVRFARMAEGVRDVNKIAQMVAEVPALADEAAAVYSNIAYALRTNHSSYLNDTEIGKLSAETAAFKADLKDLTETYLTLKETGVTDVESVTIKEGENAVVRMDNTLQLRAVVTPANTLNDSVVWTSSNEAAATVSTKGVVTPVTLGTTTITAVSAADNTKKVEITVTVKGPVDVHSTIPQFELDDKYLSDIDKPTPGVDSVIYLGQPDMIRTKTGRLITAYPQGHGHGPIVMQYSDDDGETWTKKENIPSSWAYCQETPTLYALQMADGSERLMLISACPSWDLNKGGWETSYSDDNGETWTEYKHFWSNLNGSKHATIVAMCSLIQLKDENGNDIPKWMGVYHDASYVNYKTYLTFDENGNEVWSEPEPYLNQYRSMESTYQMCEVGLFRSPDGERIVGLVRSQSHNHLSTMIYSDDEGETWSKPIFMQGSLMGERHKAAYDPVSGRLLVTFREIILDLNNNGAIENNDWIAGDWIAWVGTYGDLMEQNQGEYRILLEEDWAANAKSGDTGYAGVVVLEDGTFILDSYGHWDKEYSESQQNYNVRTDLCYIKQAKFKLTEVEEDNHYADFYLYALAESVEEAEGLREAEYTVASWANLQEKVNAAKAALENEALTNTEAKIYYDALEDAISGLISGAADSGRDIPVDKLTAEAGDYETNGGASEGPANLVLDGNNSTMWHTDWYAGPNHNNHWITLAIDGDYKVDGLRYQPRQSGPNGVITGYEIYVSNDNETWTKVADGTWGSDNSWKMASFEPVAAKYVKLQTTSATSDQSIKFASAAEIRLTGVENTGTDPQPPVEGCKHETTEVTGAVTATCTAAGYTGNTVCTACGETVEEGSEIAATGHTEVTVPGKEATCTATGLTEGKKCSVCNTEIKAQTMIAKKDHTAVAVACKEATCTETGLTEGSKCSVCEAVLVKQETVPATGHTWSDWKVTKEATVKEEGRKERKCSVCSAEEIVVIPKLEDTTSPSQPQPTPPSQPTQTSTPAAPATGDTATIFTWIAAAFVMAAAGFTVRKKSR